MQTRNYKYKNKLDIEHKNVPQTDAQKMIIPKPEQQFRMPLQSCPSKCGPLGAIANDSYRKKVKSKAVPLHAMEAHGGRGGIAPTHS
jgi:hypothetical protein